MAARIANSLTLMRYLIGLTPSKRLCYHCSMVASIRCHACHRGSVCECHAVTFASLLSKLKCTAVTLGAALKPRGQSQTSLEHLLNTRNDHASDVVAKLNLTPMYPLLGTLVSSTAAAPMHTCVTQINNMPMAMRKCIHMTLTSSILLLTRRQ